MVSGTTERLIVGLMSGTSCDGIDTALVRIKGSGLESEISLVAFEVLRYSPTVRRAILSCQGAAAGGNREVLLLDSYMGELFAHAALNLCRKAGVDPSTVDLIGSHGQTLYHHPAPVQYPGYTVTGTLQVGNPAVIAERTGITVVSDFRCRDMAAGGQGAPLAPPLDYVLYHNVSRGRIALNIGGIANATVLPAGVGSEEITAFDTGPGNCLIDLGVQKVTMGRRSFDRDGQMAGAGTVSQGVLTALMDHPFLAEKPPKSVDKDAFGQRYLGEVLQGFPELKDVDLVATLTEFTIQTIAASILEFAMQKHPIEEVIVSGGGARNPALMEGLKRAMPKAMVTSADEYAIPAKAKEAVLMAFLANETFLGNPGSLPSVTGARRAVVLGSITPGEAFFSRE